MGSWSWEESWGQKVAFVPHCAVEQHLIPRGSSGSSRGAHEATAAGEPWWESLGRSGCGRCFAGEPPEMPFGK